MNAFVEVKNLKKYYPVSQSFLPRKEKQYVKAVDDVSFSIKAGETFGLIGESGCGKSTIGRLVLRLLNPTEGSILINGENLATMTGKELRSKRKEIQIIFQDPYGSLNPRMTAGQIVAEPIHKHHILPKKQVSDRVKELFSVVGLNQADRNKFPHEFSGGQRQRIVIARALSLNPKLIVCDEPVSALDVSIQAQILNLLMELQQTYGIAYLLIAHGMAVVQHVSKRIGVMYLGKLVEVAESTDIFDHCLHPYTQALMRAVPVPDPDFEMAKVFVPLEGEVPNPIAPPSGCRFHTRCRMCCDRCKIEEPVLREVQTGHFVACHFV